MRFAFRSHSRIESDRVFPGRLRNALEVVRPWKLITLLVAAMSLFLMTTTLTYAAGNSPQGRGDPHVFRVVDKHGKLVGYSVTDNLVAREIDGVWVTFHVQPALGIFDSRAVYVYYLTTDCTGTRYLTHYSPFSEGTRVGSTLYYPTDALVLSPQSLTVVAENGEEGPCSPALDVPGAYGVATTVEVDSFGLELPFKAVQ
jgi:hypothetical protein